MEDHPNQHYLTRREFVQLVSLSGTALLTARLLSACGSRVPIAAPSPSSSAEPEASATETAAPPPTDSPEPSATWTITPPAPVEYLPDYSACGPDCPLPAPRTEMGIPLMRALSLRASSREFRSDEPPLQLISDLLWAAFGVNRPGTGKRTAPSAYNVQDMDVYLATAKGLFLYDALRHSLQPVLPDDLRAATGAQGFVAQAPLNLVYVSDAARLAAGGIGSSEDQLAFSWAHSGLIAQNVNLFCASEGLATVVRSTVSREALAGRMGLPEGQRITLAQTVGYPG